MRGRSSSAKSRLRSAGYKCNLCGRRVIDAATLERHQKTIHNISPRDNKVIFKTRPPVQRRQLSVKERNKAFDDLLKPEIEESKPSSKVKNYNREDALGGKNTNELEHSENGTRLLVEKEKKSKRKDKPRRVHFECPVCAKEFNVYFTAHKHIQKFHLVNKDGKKVGPNSPDLVHPIRVEICYRCDQKMRSNETHMCPKIIDEAPLTAMDYVCSGCNQNFNSLKTFDMHVAGLHSDSVDSMFFPTKIEFTNWRLEMERETSARYSLYGEYESKKIYRCNYARKAAVEVKSTAYFCPSSMVLQEFSKGIQVHFYNKHYDHIANPYTLSGKYKKYSITSFLKNPDEDSSIASAAYSLKLDDKDLYGQFMKLMDSIVLNSVDIEIEVLKTLIDKALEMSTVLTDATSEIMPKIKQAKTMTDKEIAEALESKSVMHKRRRSIDSFEPSSKPAKRTRNKSLFTQSDVEMSPKILNTFSLASNSNSDELKSENGEDLHLGSVIDDTNSKIESDHSKTQEKDVKISKSKSNAKLTSFNESLSFNDSYKDFIDKNFVTKSGKESKTRNSVKTKLGAFKQTSPRKGEIKQDISYDIVENNKNLRQLKSINSVNTQLEETTSKVNKISLETSKVNILSAETPNVTITKVSSMKSETPINSQINMSRMDTPKVKSRGVFSNVDPLEVNITKMSRTESQRMGARRVSSPLLDPLELNITKVSSKNISTSLESHRNVSKGKVRRFSPPLDPLQVNTTKLGTPKSALKMYSPKSNSPKVNPGRVTPKVSPEALSTKVIPKVTFEDRLTRSPKISPHKIRELKYEVREQENDCNILVLKL